MSSHKQVHQNLQTNKNNTKPPSEPRRRPQRIAARLQAEYFCAFQFQELKWVEHDDIDTKGLIIPDVLSIEPRTPVIESQKS